MAYGINPAIVFNEQALRINSAMMNDVLYASIVSVKISQIIAKLNGVLRTCTLDESISGLPVPGNNNVLFS